MGNIGTEAEFITSLNGTAGPDGADGADGADGSDGKMLMVWIDLEILEQRLSSLHH